MQDIEYSPELKKELVKTVRGHIGAFAAPDVIHWAPGGSPPPPSAHEASLMLHQNPANACALTLNSAFNVTVCSVRPICGHLFPTRVGQGLACVLLLSLKHVSGAAAKRTTCAVLVRYMHAE